jgi:hypothetical protein
VTKAEREKPVVLEGVWENLERYKNVTTNGLDPARFSLMTPEVVRFVRPAGRAVALPISALIFGVALTAVTALWLVTPPVMARLIVDTLGYSLPSEIAATSICILSLYLIALVVSIAINMSFKESRERMAMWMGRHVLLFGIDLFLMSRTLASPGFARNLGIRRRGGRPAFCWCPVVR